MSPASLPRTPLTRVPEPDLGTELIPKERYLSRRFAALENEHLWPRVWLLAGLESDLDAPGDYLTFEIARESVLADVVEGRDAAGKGGRPGLVGHRGWSGCGGRLEVRCRRWGGERRARYLARPPAAIADPMDEPCDLLIERWRTP